MLFMCSLIHVVHVQHQKQKFQVAALCPPLGQARLPAEGSCLKSSTKAWVHRQLPQQAPGLGKIRAM